MNFQSIHLNYKRILLFSVWVSMAIHPIYSQTQFQKTYGGTCEDYFSVVKETSEGGYITTGVTKSVGSGDADIWIVKTDVNGNMQWDKVYGGALIDRPIDIHEVTGGYIIGAETQSFGEGGYDYLLMKIDGTGEVLWSKTYGESNQDYARHLKVMPDNGFLLVGWGYSFGGTYIFGIRTDANGNILWSKITGANKGVSNGGVEPTSDGGYIFAAHSSLATPCFRGYVFKTDANLNPIWERFYCIDSGTGNPSSASTDVVETSDGSYVVTGVSAKQRLIYVVKFTSSGSVSWGRKFSTTGFDVAQEISETSAGDLIIMGSGEATRRGLIMKLNSGGNLQWTKSVGGGTRTTYSSGIIDTDGGFVGIGETSDYGVGGNDAIFVKTDSNGDTGYCNDASASYTQSNISFSTTSGSASATPIIPIVNNISIPHGNGLAQVQTPCVDAPISNSCTFTPLPVELLSFKAGWVDNQFSKVELNWETVAEYNNDHFEVERSTDGINFRSLFQVPAGDQTIHLNTYKELDTDPEKIKTSFYRLKQVDIDGKYAYSNIEPIYPNLDLSFISLHPNPATDNLFYDLYAPRNMEVKVKIIGALGNIVHYELKQLYKGENNLTLDIEAYGNGIYLIYILSTDGDGTLTKQFVIN